MKKYFILYFCIFCIKGAFCQNIAVPNYNQQKIDFYLGTASTPTHTLASGLGNVNGVTFSGSNMFVAGGSSGILWYSGVSFNPYNLAGKTPTLLTTGSSTIQVVADANGNIYVANHDGTVTKFRPNIFPVGTPMYTNTNKVTVRFSNDISAGLGIGIVNSIPSIWVNNYTDNSVSVCRLGDFPTSSSYTTTSTKAPFVKLLTGITNYNNEGIAFDATGAVWIGSNGTPGGYLNKIKSSTVLTIVNSLNASSNPNYALKATDIEEHRLNGGNKLGGLTFDPIYANRMYCNDQPNDGSPQSVTKNVLAFIPANMIANSPSTPIITSYLQTNPGNGQSAIVPCSLLPLPSANSISINSGQTATLTASNCVAGATYEWKDNGSVVGTSASTFTTPVLNSSKTYTVACVNSAACTGTATNVTVTVNVSPYTISSCYGNTYMADIVFNKGTASTRSMQVYLADYTSGLASVTVAGSNITGSGSISEPNTNNFILPNINYDGGGNAGSRTVTVTPGNGSAACITQVIIEEPINFTFGDCSQQVLNGNFIFGIPSNGTLVVPITVQSAGLATFTVSGLISGNLTTNLSVSQTSVTIPVSYLGGQSLPFDVEWTTNITMVKSYQSTPTNTAYNHFCFGKAFSPNPVISINNTTICSGENVNLTATGCDNGTVQWYNGGSAAPYTAIGTGITISHTPTTTQNLYKATCSPFANVNPSVSGFSNIIQVTVNPKPNLNIISSAPITDQGNVLVENPADKIVHINNSTIVTAYCDNSTILWNNNSTNPERTFSMTDATSCNGGYPTAYSVSCSNSSSCSNILKIAISNNFLINDIFTTPINTPISGDLLSNDIGPLSQVGIGLNQASSNATSISYTLSSGIITFLKQPMSSALSGNFTYYPNSGFQGIDEFKYTTHDGLACVTNYTKVRLEVGNICTTPLTVSPIVSNSGPVSSGQPVSLTAENLAPSGQSANFNAMNEQFIEVNQEILGPNSTIEFWIKTPFRNVGIISTFNSNSNSTGNIYIDNYGNLRVENFDETSIYNIDISDNKWHHIVISCSVMDPNNLSFTKTILVDGLAVYGSVDNIQHFSGQKFKIGVSFLNNQNFYFTGQLENLRIWNKQLSVSEIKQSLHLETPLNTSGLIYHNIFNSNTIPLIGNSAINSSLSFPSFAGINYYTYSWTGLNSPSPSTDRTQTTVGPAGTSYTLNVLPKILECSNITATTNVCGVIPNPTTVSATPLSIQIGQSTSLSAGGCPSGTTYLWNSGFGLASESANFTDFLYNTTNYTAYCKNGSCLSTGVPITVTVISCPQNITLQSLTSDYNSGVYLSQANATSGKITATNKITGTANVTYQAKSIELNEGFKSDNGTVFKAEVGGCN